MKMVSLSKKILKYMVKRFSDDGIDCFDFAEIKANFPGYSDDFLSSAIYLLERDELIDVQPADDVAYNSKLLPDGIRQVEKDTLIKKCYDLLTAIRNLLP